MSASPSPSTKRKLSHTSSFTKMGKSLVSLVRKKSSTELFREKEENSLSFSRSAEMKRQSQKILRAAEICCPVNGSDYLNGVQSVSEEDFVKRLEALANEEEKLYAQASPVSKKTRGKRATVTGLFSVKKEDNNKENQEASSPLSSKSRTLRRPQGSPQIFKDSTNKFSSLRPNSKPNSTNNSATNSPFKTPISTPQKEVSTPRETQRQASVRLLVQALSPNSQLAKEEKRAANILEELSKIVGFQVESIEEAESILSRLTGDEDDKPESEDEL